MRSGKITLITLSTFYFLLLTVFISCASVPKFTIDKNQSDGNREEDKELQVKYNNVENVLETVVGPASFYGKPFHGRQTSNGEIYDMFGLTAAHTTYPPNTILRVTNLSNGNKIIVRVNDHFPEHPTRVIDLSYGTAKELDMLDDGVVDVKIEVLEWGE